MFARLQSNHAFKGPTWLKPVHCMLKLSLKLAVKGQGETTNQCTPGIVCMSVQCVHGTQREPGNKASSHPCPLHGAGGSSAGNKVSSHPCPLHGAGGSSAGNKASSHPCPLHGAGGSSAGNKASSHPCPLHGAGSAGNKASSHPCPLHGGGGGGGGGGECWEQD